MEILKRTQLAPRRTTSERAEHIKLVNEIREVIKVKPTKHSLSK